MNIKVVEIALKNAQQRGLDAAGVAKLIDEYTEVVDFVNGKPQNKISEWDMARPYLSDYVGRHRESADPTPPVSQAAPPPFPVNRVIGSAKEDQAWDVDELVKALEGEDLNIEVVPDGWPASQPPVKLKASLLKMDTGVRVVYSITDFDIIEKFRVKEFIGFVDNRELALNIPKLKEGVSRNVKQTMRIRKEPIQAALPSNINFNVALAQASQMATDSFEWNSQDVEKAVSAFADPNKPRY